MTERGRSPSARRSLVLASVVLLAAVLGGGCFTTSARMHGIADAFEDDLPGLEFDHQFGLTLGRMSMGLARSVGSLAMEEDELRVFRGIRKVEMATFETRGDRQIDFPRQLEASLSRKGWETLARFKEDGELGWVVYRLDGERLKNVMVMVLDHGELTLVRLAGRLDRVVGAALEFSREEILEDDGDWEIWEDEDDWSEPADTSTGP